MIAAIVCLAVVAYFGAFALIAHYQVDMGRHLGYCGFKQRTGLPCVSCGMTTATLAFAQGNIGGRKNGVNPVLGLMMGEPASVVELSQEASAWASTDYLWSNSYENSLLNAFSENQTVERSGES